MFTNLAIIWGPYFVDQQPNNWTKKNSGEFHPGHTAAIWVSGLGRLRTWSFMAVKASRTMAFTWTAISGAIEFCSWINILWMSEMLVEITGRNNWWKRLQSVYRRQGNSLSASLERQNNTTNNHLEKYEFVNGKDDIPYMKWKNNPNVPNHQPNNISIHRVRLEILNPQLFRFIITMLALL